MDLEARFLSETIHDDPRTSSPARRHRSRSRSALPTQLPVYTDDELGSDLEDGGGEQEVMEPVMTRGTGRNAGARTGVKGVINDAKDRKALDKELGRMKVEQTNARMEARSFQALTVHEEDALRKQEQSDHAEEDVEIRRWREQRRLQLQARRSGLDDAENDEEDEEQRDTDRSRTSATRFGLREIGASGFVSAVERPGWVVVMLYEPEIQRCQSLLRALLHIQALIQISPATSGAGSNASNDLSTRPTSTPPPLLLKARASSLAFSLLPPTSACSSRANGTGQHSSSNYQDADDEDPDNVPERKSDPDVLPTILAYKDGELEHTWIRVDWDVGEDGSGLEGLFRRHSIMPTLNQSKAFGAGQEDEGYDQYA